MAFPGTYNINYYKGDTLQFDIYPKNSSGQPFDLTGYSSDFTIATARGSSATQYSGSAEIVDGRIACTIAPSVGGQLNATAQYVYDVQISNTSGTTPLIYTVLTGSITIRDHVTGAVV